MLTPNELSRAQGFPDGYKFTGITTEVVKQIGNAVPKNLAKALGQSAIRCYETRRHSSPTLKHVA